MRSEELEARVDALAAEYEGEEFVAAVRELASGLDAEERDVLGAALLRRAGTVEWAIRERYRAKGWWSRTLDPSQRRPSGR